MITIDMTMPKRPDFKRMVSEARFEATFWLIRQRGEMAKRSIIWHARQIQKARTTLNQCAEKEVKLHGGIPTDMQDPIADKLAERRNFIRILEEALQ
jgi:hypothetical protein